MLTFTQLHRLDEVRTGRVRQVLEVDDEQRDVIDLGPDRGNHFGAQEFRSWKGRDGESCGKRLVGAF